MTRHPLPMALIGLRGSGKTTLAQALSQRWNLPWNDCDLILQRESGMSIEEIFKTHGQDWFRDQESRILAQALSLPPGILATGGGVVLRQANRALLKNHFQTVWLTAPASVLAARLCQDPLTARHRPPLVNIGGEKTITPADRPLEAWTREMEILSEQREPLYRQTAHLILDTSQGSVDDWIGQLETTCLGGPGHARSGDLSWK